jgi:hypothetical protein
MPMGPMIGVMVSSEVLMAHQWYGDKSLVLPDLKLESKLTHLSVMTPYLLLPNRFISCLWDQ